MTVRESPSQLTSTFLADRFFGLVVKIKTSVLRAEDTGFYSHLCRWAFFASSNTSDLEIDTPLATFTSAWWYSVDIGTGWHGVSILWVGVVESLICSFYLRVAARKIVWADLFLRYTSMLLRYTSMLLIMSHPATIYWHRAKRYQHRPSDATCVAVLKSLVWLDLGKAPRAKRDRTQVCRSRGGRLTTWPTSGTEKWMNVNNDMMTFSNASSVSLICHCTWLCLMKCIEHISCRSLRLLKNKYCTSHVSKLTGGAKARAENTEPLSANPEGWIIFKSWHECYV